MYWIVEKWVSRGSPNEKDSYLRGKIISTHAITRYLTRGQMG